MYSRISQLIAEVTVKTTVTAMPSPFEDLMSLEILMNEHIPRKFASRMLLVNIEATNRANGLITGAAFMRRLLVGP